MGKIIRKTKKIKISKREVLKFSIKGNNPLRVFKPTLSSWLIIFLILQIIAGVFLYPPIKEAQADSNPGWFAGYNYRQQITINHTDDGAQTNYQLALTVNKISGTSSNTVCYLQNHALSWTGTVPNDIRFTKSDGVTQLDYWIESSDANTAKVWIEFDSIPAHPDNGTFYIYYGKTGDITASNGKNTFTFFDDFPGTTLNTDLWNTPGGTYTINNSIITLTSGWQALLSKNSAVTLNGRWRSRASLVPSSSKEEVDYGISNSSANHGAMLYFPYGSRNSRTADETVETHNSISGADGNTHNWEIRLNCPTDVKFYMDDTLKNIHTTHLPTVAQTFFGAPSGGASVLTIDWVFYANFTANEPTWGIWGIEEKTANSFTTTIPASIDSKKIVLMEQIIDLLKQLIQLYAQLINENLGQTADWKTYRNEEYGFEIKHPLDVVISNSCVWGYKDEYCINMLVPSIGDLYIYIYDSSRPYIWKPRTDNNLGIKEVTINGIEFEEYYAGLERSGMQNCPFSLNYVTKKNNKNYHLEFYYGKECYVPDEKESERKTIFYQMIKTFSFLD